MLIYGNINTSGSSVRLYSHKKIHERGECGADTKRSSQILAEWGVKNLSGGEEAREEKATAHTLENVDSFPHPVINLGNCVCVRVCMCEVYVQMYACVYGHVNVCVCSWVCLCVLDMFCTSLKPCQVSLSIYLHLEF